MVIISFLISEWEKNKLLAVFWRVKNKFRKKKFWWTRKSKKLANS
jgi:hypothetical protein